MKKLKITTEDSKSIEALLLANQFTYQDIINHLDNRFTINQIKYHINKYYPDLKKNIKKEYSRGGSKLEYLLKQIFPAKKIHAEYHIGKKLRLDYYIEAPYNLGFEFDGSQHHEYTPGFHDSYYDFLNSQNRDTEKDQICADNGINLIRFSSLDSISIATITELVKQAGYGSGLSIASEDSHLARQRQRDLDKDRRLKQEKEKRQQAYKKAKELKDKLSKQKRLKASDSPSSDYKQKMKEKAKEIRKQQYKRQKEWLKKNKR